MKRPTRPRAHAGTPAPRLRLEALETREVPAIVGGLDPSFGTAGKFAGLTATTAVSGVAIDPAGRTVIAGATPGAGGNDFLVARFNPNGTLDTSFGTGGKVTLDLAGADDRARGVAVDGAGNVVVVGSSDASLAVVRFKAADGAVDTTFGTGGTGRIVFTPPVGVGNLSPSDVAIDANGAIVVAGSALAGGVNAFLVARLTPTGTGIDPTFNGGGLLNLSLAPGTSSTATSLDLDGSKIVIGGRSLAAGVNKFAAVRLLANGAYDPAFGGTGRVLFNLAAGSSDLAFGVDADAAGNVYLAGSSSTAAVSKLAVAKLTSAGTLDPTFGTGGIFLAQLGTAAFDEADEVSVLPGGRVIVAGTSQVSATDFDLFAVQLTAAGKLDPTFNATGPTPGVNRFDFGANAADFAGGAVVTPQGRVVVVGSNSTTGGAEVARLIGSVEKAAPLAVGGGTDGKAPVFIPNQLTGQYAATPAAAVGPFGAIAADVRTASADVNGDGFADTILVTGPGVPIRVAVVSGKDNTTLLVQPFDPFPPGAGQGAFTAGGFVAAGDFDNDGRAEFVVTPDRSGGPRVSIYSVQPDGALVRRANFFTVDPDFRGGDRATVGDINGDGVADLVVAAGFGGGPRVAVIDGKKVFTTNGFADGDRLVRDFFAFPDVVRNGVYLAAGDVDGDGFADLIFGAAAGASPQVLIVSGQKLITQGSVAAVASPISGFTFGDPAGLGGVRVAAVDADGDNRADVVVSSGEGQPARARIYLGKNVTTTGEPGTFQDLTVFGGTALTDGVFVG